VKANAVAVAAAQEAEDVTVPRKLTAQVHDAEGGMQAGKAEHRDLQDAEVTRLEEQHTEGEEAEPTDDEVAALIDVSGDGGEGYLDDPVVARDKDCRLPLKEAWQHQRAGDDIDDEERDKGRDPLIGENCAQIVESRSAQQRGCDQQRGKWRE
jgi:hypothetical protein